MKTPFRRKLRNCIRKDTYRYYLSNENISRIWKHLEEYFGQSKEIMGFGILEIQNNKMILRKEGLSFTLIKKKEFREEDEMQIHSLIGLRNEEL